MGNLLYQIHRYILNRKLLSVLVGIALIVGTALLVSKIRFEEDITKLIPITEENKNFQTVLKTVNFADKIVVNLERSNEGSTEDLITYATQLIDSLHTHSTPYIKKIQGKVGDGDIKRTMDFVYQNLPLFLDDSDYDHIRSRLQEDSIRSITQKNYKTLISPSGIIAKKTILKDPLGLSFLALNKVQQLGIGNGFKLKNGFLLSGDEKHLLLFIDPKYPANETDINKEFAENLYRAQDALNMAFDAKVYGESYGAILAAVANAQQIKTDIKFTVGIALVLLIVILILFYRKLTLPLILFLPTLFGALFSMALLYLLRTNISAISLGIGAILLGVTLDYSLHILTHIRNGNSIKNLYKEVAPSILMSSVTTASAFLCLLFLQSRALQDLGIFAAASVMGASFFALLFIPLAYSPTAKKEVSKNVLDRLAAYKFHTNKWGHWIAGPVSWHRCFYL